MKWVRHLQKVQQVQGGLSHQADHEGPNKEGKFIIIIFFYETGASI